MRDHGDVPSIRPRVGQRGRGLGARHLRQRRVQGPPLRVESEPGGEVPVVAPYPVDIGVPRKGVGEEGGAPFSGTEADPDGCGRGPSERRAAAHPL